MKAWFGWLMLLGGIGLLIATVTLSALDPGSAPMWAQMVRGFVSGSSVYIGIKEIKGDVE